MSRRTSLVLLLAFVLAALAVLVVWRSETATSGAPEPVAPSSPEARREPAEVAAPVAGGVEARESRAVAAEIAPAPAPAAEPIPPPSAPAEVPDLDAQRPLELVVVDEMHQPVFDAAIRIDGMRSASDPGSWYQFRGEPAVARTDPKGRAKLECWTWVNVDGRTVSVDLSVTHPEYVPFRDDSFAFGEGEREIVLKRGAVVSVRAWHGAPNRLVADIEPRLEREAALGASAWTRESDGRMVTTRIAPGAHLLRVAHQPKEKGAPPLFSDVENFEVRPGERVDLVVELHAALELSGKLDGSVPRPAADGRVLLSIQETRSGDTNACLWDSFETDVRPDGTFTFADLPRGKGYVFALARGFVSQRARAATLAEAGVTLNPGATPEDEARAWEDLADIVMQLQRLEVPPASPFTIQMVATGSVEVTVLGPEGKPVADASVDVSPNVQIPGVGSILVPWRAWNARADALGVARFDDLPPDPSLWVNAGAKGLQMRAADRKDMPSVAVKSGEVARITIELERAGTQEDPAPK